MGLNFRHHHKRYTTAVAAALISITLGLALAAVVANEAYGYVAGYRWFAFLMLVGLIVAVSLLLSLILVFRSKTRWVSVILAASSVLLPISYLVGVKAFEKVGWSRYAHERMIRFGPDVRTSLLVIYKKDTTDQQIESFLQENLSRPHPEGRGYDLLDGMTSRTRLNIHGYVATAIELRADASQEQRDRIRVAINSSPIVHKVMENVIPSEIEAIDETPPSNNGMHPTANSGAFIENLSLIPARRGG